MTLWVVLAICKSNLEWFQLFYSDHGVAISDLSASLDWIFILVSVMALFVSVLFVWCRSVSVFYLVEWISPMVMALAMYFWYCGGH